MDEMNPDPFYHVQNIAIISNCKPERQVVSNLAPKRHCCCNNSLSYSVIFETMIKPTILN